jgi:hypothetical protein
MGTVPGIDRRLPMSILKVATLRKSFLQKNALENVTYLKISLTDQSATPNLLPSLWPRPLAPLPNHHYTHPLHNSPKL